MSQTELVISRAGFPPFSARGVIQTLEPLLCGEMRRTIDGRLVYTGLEGHKKYRSMVRCEDKTALSLGNIWRGSEVGVACLSTLIQEISGDKEACIPLLRPAVPGSVIVYDEQQNVYGSVLETGNESARLTGEGPMPQKLYLAYRPFLMMRLIKFKVLTDEWGGKVGWQMDLEEV